MRPFIKGKKGKFHIIDLNKTQKVLESVYRLVYDVTAKGGKILFVGTKNEHFKEELQNQCKRVKANYVTQR
jgi:small subunit ribosomal protein S2